MSIFDEINKKVQGSVSSLYGAPAPAQPVYPTPTGGPINYTPYQGSYAQNPGYGIPKPPVTPTPAPVAKPTIGNTKPAGGATFTIDTSKPAPGAPVPVKAPDDPSNKFNTATGQPNPNYVPAPGSAASLMYNAPVVDPAQKIIEDRNRALATENIDPNAVYAQTLSQFQSQIDAINNIYNDQLNNSRIVNAPTYKARADQNRIGQVLGGLVASPMGDAQTDNVNNVNAKEQAAAEAIINDRRAQELAAIRGEIRQSQEAALKAKYEAQKLGSDAVLAEINARPEKKKAALSNAIKALIAGGHDITKMTPEELASFTSGLGVSKDEFTAEYKTQEAATTAAKTKAEQDAFKALPASAQEYEYAKKNGYKGSYDQYQTADANRKALASRQPTKLTIGEQHATTVSNISQVFSPGAKIPNSDGVPFIDDNGFATPEGFKTAQKAAQQDGLPRKDFITQFGFLIAPGSESSYGITPAEVKLITGTLPEGD